MGLTKYYKSHIFVTLFIKFADSFMKKIISIVTSGLLLLSLTSCVQNNKTITKSNLDGYYKRSSIALELGIEALEPASDKALVGFYRAADELKKAESRRASKQEIEQAKKGVEMAMANVVLYENNKSPPHCDKKQVMQDLFITSTMAREDGMAYILSLPLHRSACVLRKSIDIIKKSRQ